MRAQAWLGLCLLAALGLRAWDLGGPALWLDEIGQVMVARGSWAALPDQVAQHLSPPLDYALLKLAMGVLGSGDAAVRVPALLSSVAAVGLGWAWALRIGGEGLARWMALLSALSPMALVYGREARMYALFLALACGAWLLLERLQEKPGLARALALGGWLGAALLTHYYAFALLGAVLAVGLARRRGDARWLALAAAVAAACFAPWTPWFLRQLRASGAEIGYGLPPTAAFFRQVLSAFGSYSGVRDPWFYAALALGLAGAVLAWRRRERPLLEAAAVLAAALAALWALSFWRRTGTDRNFIWLLPTFLALAARALLGLERALARRWPRIAFGGLALTAALGLAPALHERLTRGRQGYQPDWRAAAVRLAERDSRQPVWVPDPHSRGSLAYYLDPGAPYVFMAGRSLDPANRPGDRIRVLGSSELEQALSGRLEGVLVMPNWPLSFSPGPEGMPAYQDLYARADVRIPGQRPEGEIRLLFKAR